MRATVRFPSCRNSLGSGRRAEELPFALRPARLGERTTRGHTGVRSLAAHPAGARYDGLNVYSSSVCVRCWVWRRVTRQPLHAPVWQQPIIKVAKKIGLSEWPAKVGAVQRGRASSEAQVREAARSGRSPRLRPSQGHDRPEPAGARASTPSSWPRTILRRRRQKQCSRGRLQAQTGLVGAAGALG